MKYTLSRSIRQAPVKVLWPLLAFAIGYTTPATRATNPTHGLQSGPIENLRPIDPPEPIPPGPIPPEPIPQSPVGVLESVEDGGTVVGWAYDPNVRRLSIQVLLTFDGPAGVGADFFVTANVPRPELGLPGNHGFRFVVPDQYRDGRFHTVNAYGIDATADEDEELFNSPQSFILGRLRSVEGDYDGDGTTDTAVFRPSDRTWYLRRPDNSFAAIQFGFASDLRVPGDYDGDRRTNIAVFRPSEANWYIGRADSTLVDAVHFGLPGDIPVPGDYNGDGLTDIAVFRPSDSTWYIRRPDGSFYGVPFGSLGDKLVPADYDGDGKTDIAVFRPSEGRWYLLESSEGLKTVQYGLKGDVPVPSDYDGDGRAEIAVVRPTNSPEGAAWVWYIAHADGTQINQLTFGNTTDRLVPGDYDGDGKSDIAVYRPTNGTWYIARPDGSFYGIQFGAAGDEPLPVRPIN